MNSTIEEGAYSGRILSEPDCNMISHKANQFISRGGFCDVRIQTSWTGNIRWARNEVISSGDQQMNLISVTRTIRGASAKASISDLSDSALKRAVETCERRLQLTYEAREAKQLPELPREEAPPSHVWHESTFNLLEEERAEICQQLATVAEKKGMLSAGYIQVSGKGGYTREYKVDQKYISGYSKETDAQISITVRSPDGTASGWAGVTWDNWSRVNGDQIAEIALDKCLRSLKPVAIEPGRYTVVLEPQAVHDLVSPLFAADVLSRGLAENPRTRTVYTLRPGYSKIGLRLFDPRLKVYSDPYHPDCSYLAQSAWSPEAFRKTTYVDEGVLVDLRYSRGYGISQLGLNTSRYGGESYIIEGGDSTIETMISNTERGLLVTRLHQDFTLDEISMLSTGTTRDGLWLIERGKVSTAVRNLRYTESPMFVLNNILEIGQQQRVFSPGRPALVPAIRARDFSFTATINAV